MNSYFVASEQSPNQILEPLRPGDPSIYVRELMPRFHFVSTTLYDMHCYQELAISNGHKSIVVPAVIPILGFNDKLALEQIQDRIEKSENGLMAVSSVP